MWIANLFFFSVCTVLAVKCFDEGNTFLGATNIFGAVVNGLAVWAHFGL